MDKVAVTQRLIKFEGSIPHMYMCSGGEVTVGVGHAIQSEDEALTLEWDAEEHVDILQDYSTVSSFKGENFTADYYQDLTVCRMADEDIAALCASDIEIFEAQLRDALPDWILYPEMAQQALFDMGFNLGIAGLMKFPKMLAAIDSGDWVTAALESHRQGIQDSRNEEIFELYLSCGEEVAV